MRRRKAAIISPGRAFYFRRFFVRGWFRSRIMRGYSPPLLRVNGQGDVSPVPLHPRHRAENLPLARYAPRWLHLAERVGLDLPVSTHPLAAVLAASPGCAPAFPPGFPDAHNCPAVSPQSVCRYLMADIKEAGSGLFHSETMKTCSDALVPAEIGEPKVGRRGLAAREGGQRRIETGQNCPEQF